MPRTNTIRHYINDGKQVFHIFNRSPNNSFIFLDNHDYDFFLKQLAIYTLDPETSKVLWPRTRREKLNKCLYQTINVYAYCLMPTHFHLLIQQKNNDSIPRLMQQLLNSYVSYFNSKYNKRGKLLEGQYRAKLVDNENYLLGLSRYIHLNPLRDGLSQTVESYKWSSINEYVHAEFICQTSTILQYFSSRLEYLEFNKTVQPNENNLYLPVADAG